MANAVIFDTYIATLRRQTAERRAQRAAEAEAVINDPRAVLRAQLVQWQAALPDATRAEAARDGYTLEDIRKAVHATPQSLGLVLDELGWSRRRIWRNDGPYRRRWYPPNQCITPPKTEAQGLNLVGVFR